MPGFRTPWNATSRTTAQDALHQHILYRNTSSQPFMTPCARQVMNRIPGNVTPPPPEPGAEGRSTHAQWAEQDTYQHREIDNQQGRPPGRGPHRIQARRPRVPCCIGPHYGIISTLKIPVVSSGTTWTLQLWNYFRTCITQGPEYFRHQGFGFGFPWLVYSPRYSRGGRQGCRLPPPLITSDRKSSMAAWLVAVSMTVQ